MLFGSNFQIGYRYGGTCPSPGPPLGGSPYSVLMQLADSILDRCLAHVKKQECKSRHWRLQKWASRLDHLSKQTRFVVTHRQYSGSAPRACQEARMYCNLQYMRASQAIKCCNLQHFLALNIGKSFPSYGFFSQRSCNPANPRRNPPPSTRL